MTKKKEGPKAAPANKLDWSKATLIVKLSYIHSQVSFLKKDQQGHNFVYVSSAQVLLAIRDLMDEVGILLIPKMERTETRDHTTLKEKHEYFTEIWFTFTWINVYDRSDTLQCPWYAQGLDDGEKGPGIAATYAEKMFILKTFNIATDKLDPDAIANDPKNPRNKNTKTKPAAKTAEKIPPPQYPKCVALVLADKKIRDVVEAYRGSHHISKKVMAKGLEELWKETKGDEKKYLAKVEKEFEDDLPFEDQSKGAPTGEESQE